MTAVRGGLGRVETSVWTGQHTAFGTTACLLNVPAGNMSALADELTTLWSIAVRWTPVSMGARLSRGESMATI